MTSAGPDLAYRIVAQVPLHAVDLEALSVFPGEQRYRVCGKLLDEVTLHFDVLRPEVDVVFPGENLDGGIHPVAFLGHDPHRPAPVPGPVLHVLLTCTVTASPFLVPEAFGQKDITLDVGKLLQDIVHQLAQPRFAFRRPQVLVDDRRVDLDSEA